MTGPDGRRGAGGRLLPAVLVALVLLAACAPSAGPAAVPFARVALPDGAVPQVPAAAGQDLLVGVRHGGGPGLLRIGPDGSVTPVAVVPATGYGRTASWYSLAFDGGRVAAIGGDRGGAHGNVRWSVWTGSGTAVHEQAQAFSTFGGWGAGGLVDAVLTPAGPVVVGSWQGAGAGLDVALWTPAGGAFVRHESTGTALAGTRDALAFPVDATALREGVLVVGWQVAGGRPQPVAWEAVPGAGAPTRTPLPGAGTSGAATAARCAHDTCAVSGRVDGALALWRRTGGTWTRVPGLPTVPVADHDPLPAPLNPAGPLVQVVSHGPRIEVLTVDGPTTEVRPAEGPTGAAVSAVEAGGWVYLLAGPDADALQLWRADAAAVR